MRGFFFGLLLAACNVYAVPQSFDEAKRVARDHVYADRHQGQNGTFYCGCDWQWTGRSGGRVDLASCDYKVRSQSARAARIEWEHVVPASNFGRARQCWQNGGRKHCNATDPVFNAMEGDLHNLTPAIGEVNADRSNFNFGMLPTTPQQHGACPVKVDFKGRTVEPRDEIKGHIARIYFYMFDRYDLQMSRQQQQLLMAWDKQFPLSEWERERDKRIAALMGHHNPFVTGERQWQLGHRNHAEGIVSAAVIAEPRVQAGEVRGNKNSRVYHLPLCPHYERVDEKNRVVFTNEQTAIEAGFRKAGNCS